MAFRVKPLSPATWPDFTRLVEKHNGIWGGCWCMSFHPEGVGHSKTALQNRTEKERRVRDGHAHAALVYDGTAAVGWCQFGPADELPRIKNKRSYNAAISKPPDWRITCFFVDRDCRRTGVASAALKGALQEIARLGGGRVESYPEEVVGRTASSSFLHNGTLTMLKREGFRLICPLGKSHWLVAKEVFGRSEAGVERRSRLAATP